MSNQAEKGHGRKLRRARNMIRRFESGKPTATDPRMEFGEQWRTKNELRYNRAKALVLADKLQAS
jgi:hypothetical protein